MKGKARLMLKLRQAPHLEALVVGIIEIVKTDDRLTGRQQLLTDTGADEACAARDDHGSRQRIVVRNKPLFAKG